MSFTSNERLFALYEAVADQLSEEQIEILLRRAGLAPDAQEIKDIRHRIQAVIRSYVPSTGRTLTRARANSTT